MDKEKRYKERPDLYKKDGMPKKSAMLCHDRQYISEVKRCNPGAVVTSSNICGGLRCPLYSLGCGK